MNLRQRTLKSLRTDPDVNVLIIGGGVNGAGLFRELALQGVSSLLIDRSDFVAGASSNSSRMIHGGLRYLENREFGLVREALEERDRLLENAAHYVAPLKTTIPLYSRFGGLLSSALVFCGLSGKTGNRGAAPVKIGMWFYDFVTRKNRKLPTHVFHSRAESLQEVPALNPQIVGAATYYDAWISHTERLCIELIQDARRADERSLALNYVGLAGTTAKPCATGSGAVVGAVASAGTPGDTARAIRSQTAANGLPVAHNTEGSVALRDELTGETFFVRPRIVVNATGAWIDRANAALGTQTRFIGGTKGSHLVLNNRELHTALGGRNGRMVYYQHSDGRVCIVFPFMDKVIAGTTDIRVSDPDSARCDDSEIDYILTTLRGVFPAIAFSREQIVFTYCGVRPLPASGDEMTGTISRGHSVKVLESTPERPFPVFCLIGGKWTTFRAFAEQVSDLILARFNRSRKMNTAATPIGGGKGFPTDAAWREKWIHRVAQSADMSHERATDLLERYGAAAEQFVAEWRVEGERPLRSLPKYSVGEIERIARDEYVEHLDDIVRRRSTIALLGDARPEVLAEIAEIAGNVLGWDADRRAMEVKTCTAKCRS